MSFHFCTHPWEVRTLPAGIQVMLTRRDLDPESIATLVDDLLATVLENGKRDLYLDLGEIAMVPSALVGKMVALNARLHDHGGRLIAVNIDPAVHDALRKTRLCDIIELRLREAGDTDATALF